MSTKDYYSLSKQNSVDKLVINQNGNNQYNNINLNQTNKNDVTIVKSQSKLSKNEGKDYDSVDSKNDLTKTSSNSSKKNDISETFKSLNPYNSENDKQKKWKNNNNGSANNSTLSLHIKAYANSLNILEKINKTSKNAKFMSFTSPSFAIRNQFEFPRQRESVVSMEPELMQYNASQTLLNPNEMLPPNIIYGHTFPRNNNNVNINSNNNIFHHFPSQHPPPNFLMIDGVWHRMPTPFLGNFYFPEPQFLYSPPSLDNVFDYNNAIFIEEEDVPGQEAGYSEYGLRRLTSSEITEDDLAFLKSTDKVLCNLEETPPNSSKENSPLQLSSPATSHFSPIFLSPSPSLIPHHPQYPRKPAAKRSNARKSTIKSSPAMKRPYRKSAHHCEEHFPKLVASRPRKQPPPLRISSLDISRGFVGFCGVLKVNPYYAGCTGRITTIKDEINHTYFVCANCGTRRRYLEESNSNSNLLE